ncbi:MAG: DUF1932 domain-containing protein [Desulfocucumaceae bacterium]
MSNGDDTLRLGFLGFGEAGYEIAKGLKSEGINRIFICHRKRSDPARARAVRARAEEVGAVYLRSIEEVVELSEVVISVVTPDTAEGVAKVASTFLKPEQVYLDLTSSQPSSMERVARTIEISGGMFVDGAIMASVPVFRHHVLIYTSGKAAKQLALKMNQYGMNIQVVGDRPGEASAIKLLVSVASKGLEALLVEMLLAAHHYRVEEVVLAALNEFFKMGLNELVDRFVGSDAIHAARRAEEMKGAAEMLRQIGLDPIMSDATVQRLNWSASLGLSKYFGEVLPKGYKDVIKAWEREGIFNGGR